MPLYIPDDVIEKRMCGPVAKALKEIKYEMEDHRVTPSIALHLIKTYLLPLIPAEHSHILADATQASWERLVWRSVSLVTKSIRHEKILEDIGVSIEWICEYTTLPPRKIHHFEKVETNHFLQICNHFNLEEEHLRFLGKRKIDVLKACKYCWRLPVQGRSICPEHTISENARNDNTKQRSLSAIYKEGKRQKEVYDKAINRILTDEVLAFHDSNFSYPILLPKENIWSWLQERRPHIAHVLTEYNQDTKDALIIDSLLNTLHSTSNLDGSRLETYNKVNEHIKSHPQLIWPMLIRAEAWFITRSKKRSNWGGNRSASMLDNLEEKPISNKYDELFNSEDYRPINTD